MSDPEDAFLVREALDNAGLEIMTGCSATGVVTDKNGITAVALNNGKKLPCQMICVGKGVIPNTDFIKGTGIELDRGISADKYTVCEPFVAMGVVHTRDKDLKVYTDRTGNTFRKIVFSKDGTRLIGALFIGDITNAGIYRYVIREKKNIDTLKHHLINQTLHYGHFL